jgi:hypothetical protein
VITSKFAERNWMERIDARALIVGGGGKFNWRKKNERKKEKKNESLITAAQPLDQMIMRDGKERVSRRCAESTGGGGGSSWW